MALCSAKLFDTSSRSLGSFTSIPGHPNQLKLVDLVSPDSEVTRPPLESEDLKVPSCRLTERGRRLETMMRRLRSCSGAILLSCDAIEGFGL